MNKDVLAKICLTKTCKDCLNKHKHFTYDDENSRFVYVCKYGNRICKKYRDDSLYFKLYDIKKATIIGIITSIAVYVLISLIKGQPQQIKYILFMVIFMTITDFALYMFVSKNNKK